MVTLGTLKWVSDLMAGDSKLGTVGDKGGGMDGLKVAVRSGERGQPPQPVVQGPREENQLPWGGLRGKQWPQGRGGEGKVEH